MALGVYTSVKALFLTGRPPLHVGFLGFLALVPRLLASPVGLACCWSWWAASPLQPSFFGFLGLVGFLSLLVLVPRLLASPVIGPGWLHPGNRGSLWFHSLFIIVLLILPFLRLPVAEIIYLLLRLSFLRLSVADIAVSEIMRF